MQLEELQRQLKELEKQLEGCNRECSLLVETNERSELACALEREKMLEQRQYISQLQNQLHALQQQLSDKEQVILDRDDAIRNMEGLIASMYSSTSWRITAPLRAVKRSISNLL